MVDERDVELLLAGVGEWNDRMMDWDGPIDLRLDFRNLFGMAGKLGDNGEIPLAGYSFYTNDLAGANLTGANLTDAELVGADLTGAKLVSANLTDAVLSDTVLIGADLTNADLTDAFLSDAFLSDAFLSRVNFTRANLTNADLAGADLTNANLTNAILYKALCITTNFTDANLTGTKLWEAVIFDGTGESPKQHQIELTPIASIGNLLTGIKKIKSRYQRPEEAFRFYFRGEAQTGYKLQPSAMREKAFIENEGAMLTDLASRRPEEFNGLVSGLAQLVLAQHHDLKTRFLDISNNPLVALFHACGGGESSQDHSKRDGRLHVFVVPRQMVKPFNSDTVSVVANYARLPRHHQKALIGRTDENASYAAAMEQLVQLIQSEKPYFAPRINPRDFYRVIIVEPQQSPERIRAQSGAFLVSAFHERFEPKEILQWNPRIPVYAHYPLTVSRKAKTDILDELRMLNITRETLFPGLDTAAKAIMESYRQRQQ